MEGMTGITPTYNLAEHSGYNDGFGFGGGSGIWLFAILALMWGGNGLFGRNSNDCRCATVEDLNNSANFTRLENQVGINGQAIAQGFTNMGNGICNLGYQLATDFGSLSKEIATCCCENKQISLENRYLAAQNTAEINANVVAQVQSIKDLIYQEKANAQAAKIQQLELNQALCGVVRYPVSATYNAGNPFFGYGCGGNNI